MYILLQEMEHRQYLEVLINMLRSMDGKAQEWTKKAGKIESDKYIFDIHWVEHSQYGKYDEKIGGKTLK